MLIIVFTKARHLTLFKADESSPFASDFLTINFNIIIPSTLRPYVWCRSFRPHNQKAVYISPSSYPPHDPPISTPLTSQPEEHKFEALSNIS